MKKISFVASYITVAVILNLLLYTSSIASRSQDQMICSRGFLGAQHSLKSGYGPGTPFENSVSFAALEGNVHKLNNLFISARHLYSKKYVTQWLNTALFNAVISGHTSAVVFLLKNGAQINRRAMYMQTPPFKSKSTSNRHYLEPAGTPLANAVSCVRPKMTNLLLNHGANMYLRESGFHPEFTGNIVYGAVTTGSAPLVRVFLKHGLDPCRVAHSPYTLAEAAGKSGLTGSILKRLKCKK